MNDALFLDVQRLSSDIQQRLNDDQREGLDDLIEQRNTALRQWFEQVNDLINLTNEQQRFLEDLLAKEQEQLNRLNAEQAQIQKELGGLKGASKYQEITDQ